MKRFFFSILVFLFIAVSDAKPTVEILATGGTIAGVAASQTSTTYVAGSLSAQQLINSVNGLESIANIKYTQVYNKDSGNITISDWMKLYAEVNKAAQDPSIDAIVITHGTDTLEETAYFLNLVAKTEKPIVLVGSMRASTSMSADGPLNLYNAVAVAISPQTHNRGVLVVMNEKIFGARNVTKTHTTNVDTFQSPNSGPLGDVVMGEVSYYSTPNRASTTDTPFKISNDTTLPNVAIIYEYVGVDTKILAGILKDKTLKGIVIAGVGDGNIPSYEHDFLVKARKAGIVVVRSSRTGSGIVSYDYNNLDTTYGLIAGDNLRPEKARILLMLSLLQTNDIKQIQQNFYKY